MDHWFIVEPFPHDFAGMRSETTLFLQRLLTSALSLRAAPDKTGLRCLACWSRLQAGFEHLRSVIWNALRYLFSSITIGSQHCHDFPVRAFDGSDLAARSTMLGIAFREQCSAALARDRKRDAPLPDGRFTIRSKEQKPRSAARTPRCCVRHLAWFAKPAIDIGIRFVCCPHRLSPRSN